MQIMKREIRGGSALLTAYIQDKSEAIHASRRLGLCRKGFSDVCFEIFRKG